MTQHLALSREQNHTWMALCSRQELLPGHLTARESLMLFAALWGQRDQSRVDEMLRSASLKAYADHPQIHTLPRETLRALHWAIASLPDPDLILVDHLTDQLSQPAKRHLLGLVRAEQACRPRTILFATSDLEAARTLSGEVWWVEQGKVIRRWNGAELPPMLRVSAKYAFDFKSARAARRFIDDTNSYPAVISSCFCEPRTVEVLAAHEDCLVDLAWMAGYGLDGLRTLPLQTDALPAEWAVDLPLADGQPFSSVLDEILVPHGTGHLPHHWASVCQLALAEWRGHFRSFMKAGNVVFSSLYLLISITAVLPAFETLEGFWRWATVPLLLSSTLVLGLGLESINRLVNAGQAETLFHPTQERSATRPFSLLALYDQTPAGRGTVLAGVALGQVGVTLAHAWPLVLFGVAIGVLFPQPPPLLLASFLFWLLILAAGLALNVLVGSVLCKPGRGLWISWLLWLLISLSGFLPHLSPQPWLWIWPFAGFTAAFARLGTPAQAVLPFTLGLLGTGLLWGAAQRVFRTRPAIWREYKEGRV